MWNVQNINKNNPKVTTLPTAKLIEIAVANCKNDKDYHNLEILSCTKASPLYFQIAKYTKSAILARFSYESRSFILSNSRYSRWITKEMFCDFRNEFIEKQTVKVENFLTIIMKWAKHCKF